MREAAPQFGAADSVDFRRRGPARRSTSQKMFRLDRDGASNARSE
jgi:hypothetical protein